MTGPAFERVPAAAGPRLQGFAGTGFRVDDTVFAAVLLTPEKALLWDPPALDALSEDHVAPLLDIGPEFILLGTGPGHLFPPRGFVAALEKRGVGVEAMESRAAARCWGLLRGEGRWIAAALMPL